MQQINLKEIETAVNQYGKVVLIKNSKNNFALSQMKHLKS